MAETKKTTTKKATAKKPVAKKTTIKKPVAKKVAVKKVEEVKVDGTKNTKEELRLFKILSYVGILWIIGFFVKSKDDKALKFHMGQGMILTIVAVILNSAVSLVNNLVIYNIFVTKTIFWGYESVAVSGFGYFIAGLFNFACWVALLYLMIKGIINVRDEKETNLPIVGKYSFFK